MEIDESYTPYSEQVAGSFPLLTKEDGKIYKPATESEHKFYSETIENTPVLKPFLAKFYGQVTVTATLEPSEEKKRKVESLQDISNQKKKQIGSWSYTRLVKKLEAKRYKKLLREEEEACASQKKSEPASFVYLVLENLTFNLDYPHVLDLKMGTQQHGSNEPESKKLSKSKKCLSTTSSSRGIRICGLQMFDVNKREIRKDKYWGRGLDDEALTTVLQMFVSFLPDFSSLPVVPNDPDSDFHSKRFSGKKPFKVRREVVKSLIRQLDEVIRIVKELDWRFYGSSALITFSGGPSKTAHPEPHFRIIDFANAETNEHQGHDEGFLFGLENLRKIFADALALEC